MENTNLKLMDSKSALNESVQFIKGVGPNRKKLFLQLGIETVEDLLYFFPRRYEDRRNLISIAKVELSQWQTISGVVIEHGARRSWYSKKHVTEVTLDDNTGRMCCVWFNQPYLNHYFQPGKRVVCHGKVDIYKNRLQMVSPEYEVLGDDDDAALSVGRIVPIYSLTKGVTQRYLRKTIHLCLDRYLSAVQDELPVSLRNKYRLYNLRRCLLNIHFPEDPQAQDEALRRISFEEFFFFQVSVALRRLSITQKKGTEHVISEAECSKYIHSFSFPLTSAQQRVIREIRSDMGKPTPMLRLLQGDVGSGKTIAALYGVWTAFRNGHQSVVMAPTEILAKQHFETVRSFVESGIFRGMKVCLLASSVKEKDKVLKDIQRGKVDLVIGTHAVINSEVKFKDLSYAVIDEQHKFGVRQRALLSEKGSNPDILIMTATPIPRTLCITLYGDLDLSTIDELPLNRGQVLTKHFLGERAEEVYEIVRMKLKEGRQAYIVYPIIDDSDNLELKAAKSMFGRFKKDEFKDFKLELIHGQTGTKDSERIMSQFTKGKIDLLVATTVLEVGVDVPNATVMVIEHAERFGLSQLHQLRGRIGRGAEESLCILLADPVTEDALERINTILETTDGFKIAQKDLLIRGPGHFFGRHQHGLNELKVANPATQLDILEIAREEAVALTRADVTLSDPKNIKIKEIVKKRYPLYLEMVEAG